MKIAHILNVAEMNDATRARYLHVAQPVTMKSMIIARDMAKGVAEVELVAVKHKDENVSIPPEFVWAADLDKYAWEHIEALADVLPHRPLPRLEDIISSICDVSKADYFVYTNLDIGLYPHFYLEVADMVERGYDAMCINRRDLPKEHQGVLLDDSRIELVFMPEGKLHAGIDCFVFKRDIVPSLRMGNVYIGYPPVGQVLKTQIEANSSKFTWIKEKRLTFHIGCDRAWQNVEEPYFKVNKDQAEGLYVQQFEKSSSRRLRNKVRSLVRRLSK